MPATSAKIPTISDGIPRPSATRPMRIKAIPAAMR